MSTPKKKRKDRAKKVWVLPSAQVVSLKGKQTQHGPENVSTANKINQCVEEITL